MTERDSAPGTGTAEEAVSSDGSIAPEAAGAGQRTGQRPATRPVAVRPVRAPIAGLRQRMESTAALRRSLDAREAEALDLRASIDRLRQELDREQVPSPSPAPVTAVPSAPAPRSPAEGTRTRPTLNGAAATHERAAASSGSPASTPAAPTAPVQDDVIEDTITRPRTAGRSRRSWLWALAAVVLTILVLLLLSRCGSAGTGTNSATTDTGTNPTASSGQSPVASSEAGAAPATTPMAWPSGAVLVPPGLPAAGPGLSTAGSHLELALDTDGSSVDAYESLILPGASTEPLVLTLATIEGGGTPSLRDVQVELDGKPAALTTAADGSISAAPPGGAYTKAVVRYRLAGTVTALQPAKANRAAAMVMPLTAGASQAVGTPVVVRTTDRQVIAAECPTVALAQRLCAAPKDGAWAASVPAAATPAAVYLLLDTSR